MYLLTLPGHSINDGIGRELCSFHYVYLGDAAARVAKLGQSVLLAKMDIGQDGYLPSISECSMQWHAKINTSLAFDGAVKHT